MADWIVEAPGARIAVFEYGNRSADATVLLVHGYPDDHHVFDPLIAEFGDRARIIAYDTRGGGETVVDDGLSNYSIERLAADAFAVVDSIPDRAGPVHVLAHDWGSVQMWEAMASPRAAQAFASYVSVSGPSLDHMRELSRSWLLRPTRWPSLATQLGRSWYIWGFHVPVLRGRVPHLFSIRPISNAVSLCTARTSCGASLPALPPGARCPPPSSFPAVTVFCPNILRRIWIAGFRVCASLGSMPSTGGRTPTRAMRPRSCSRTPDRHIFLVCARVLVCASARR